MYAGNLDLSQELVFTVEGVLSPGECRGFIERMETLGCTDAPVSTSAGFVMMPELRNNARVIIDDADLAALLFSRVRDSLPNLLMGMRLCGANERLRCYRYQPGQRFALHSDGAFFRSPHEQSLLTFMVYLNEDFTGGATNFPQLPRTIVPKTGMALFFQHPLLHEGCEVESGIKYALRSDVMYRST